MAFAWTEFCFSMFYLFDLMLKLSVLPFAKHFSSIFNRVEALFTLLLAVACILWVLPVPWPPAEALRYFNIIRLVTLSALLGKVGQIGVIFQAIMQVVTGTAPVITLLGVVISLWCILGVQLYGGIVYQGNPDLEDTSLMSDHLDIFNYNDFGLAAFTFLSALVAGAPNDFLMDAYAAAGPGGQPLSAIFHMLAYYLLTCILYNVFTSFVIDAFLTFYQAEHLAADCEHLECETSESDADLKERIKESISARDLKDKKYELVSKPMSRATRVYQTMFADELSKLSISDLTEEPVIQGSTQHGRSL